MFVVYVRATLSGYLTSELTMGKYPWLAQSVATARFFSSFDEARAANVGGIPGYEGKDIFRVQLELVQSAG